MRVKRRTLWATLLAILTALTISLFAHIHVPPSSPLLAQTAQMIEISPPQLTAVSMAQDLPPTSIAPVESEPIEVTAEISDINSAPKRNSKFEPKFARIGKYTTTIPANGDRTDIYYPLTETQAKTNRPEPLPIALLLQGFNVENSFYSKFATQIAKHGFIVIAPNHYTSVRGKREIFAQVGQVPDAIAFARAENQNSKSPLAGTIDVSRLVLIGHSHGGFIGMDAIRNACDPPWCVGKYMRPPELLAGVFYGADLWDDGSNISIKNDRIPIAFIAGSKDSLIDDDSVKTTYQLVQTPPKLFVNVLGANHYGIADRHNPPGAPDEKNASAIAQDTARDTIGRWTAAFLRAYATNDAVAMEFLQNGAKSDRGVNVLMQM
jgi:dienelactone hydrolase